MKILLTTLNAKFSHSNLAIRSLKAYCQQEYPNIDIAEFTINDNYDLVVSEIFSRQPDLIGFSCYIWNIRQSLDIAETIKQLLPKAKIILGGPEVSYDSLNLLNSYPFIDFIAVGEGEQVFCNLLKCLHEKLYSFEDIKGLAWRDKDKLYLNEPAERIDLDTIPFVYKKGFDDLKNRIVYYESSRGCPFNCQYCLSSTTKGVNFLSIERVKEDLRIFVESGIRQVKLVDRTFNCNLKRTKEIFNYLIELGGNTNFHFEMAGDLIDEEMLSIIKRAPVGLFQFEIGIQSSNLKTLTKIKRKSDLGKLVAVIKEIISFDNMHVHLDLIAGLPEEDMSSMKESVNFVLAMKPHKLQLGFLKLLKGSGLRKSADIYDYKYTQYPPYEVLSNKYIGYEELSRLKDIELVVEKYYNSHRFSKTINYLLGHYDNNAFELFYDMGQYWRHKGYFSISHANESLYTILFEFVKSGFCKNLMQEEEDLINDLLLFDFCRHVKPGRYPVNLKQAKIEKHKQKIRDFFEDQTNVDKYLSDNTNLNIKRRLNRMHIELFSYRVDKDNETVNDKEDTFILFNYDRRQGVLKQAEFRRLTLKT